MAANRSAPTPSRARLAALGAAAVTGAAVLGGCGGASAPAPPAASPTAPATPVVTAAPTTVRVHPSVVAAVSTRDPFGGGSTGAGHSSAPAPRPGGGGSGAAANSSPAPSPSTSVAPTTTAPATSNPPTSSPPATSPPATTPPPTTTAPAPSIAAQATDLLGRAMADARRSGFAATYLQLAAHGSTERVQGNAGSTRGIEQIKVGKASGYVLDSAGKAFFLGNAAAARTLLHLPASVASGAAGEWISVPRSSHLYAPLVAGATLPSFVSRLPISGPYGLGRAVATLKGRGLIQLVAISGRATPGGFLAKAGVTAATLYVTAGADPVPFQLRATTKAGPVILQTVFGTRYPIPAAPRHAVPLASLLHPTAVSGRTPPTFPPLHLHRS